LKRVDQKRDQETASAVGFGTVMWSVTVFEPALPERSSMAKLSPVFAHHAPRGWNPKPR
jgi:hypothetical protein